MAVVVHFPPGQLSSNVARLAGTYAFQEQFTLLWRLFGFMLIGITNIIQVTFVVYWNRLATLTAHLLICIYLMGTQSGQFHDLPSRFGCYDLFYGAYQWLGRVR